MLIARFFETGSQAFKHYYSEEEIVFVKKEGALEGSDIPYALKETIGISPNTNIQITDQGETLTVKFFSSLGEPQEKLLRTHKWLMRESQDLELLLNQALGQKKSESSLAPENFEAQSAYLTKTLTQLYEVLKTGGEEITRFLFTKEGEEIVEDFQKEIKNLRKDFLKHVEQFKKEPYYNTFFSLARKAL